MKLKINMMLLGLSLALGGTAFGAVTWEDDGKTLVTDESGNHLKQADVDKAETIKIHTTQKGSGLPAGHGFYGNASNFQYADKKVEIRTTGAQADGIFLNAQSSKAHFGDGLLIHVSGESSDGINLSENSWNDHMVVGANADISSVSGVGVRVNNSINNSESNKLQIGSEFVIATKGEGTNDYEGSGYGVYAGLRDRKLVRPPNSWFPVFKEIYSKSDSRIILGENGRITTSGKNAHAVYANRSGKIVIGSGVNIKVTGNGAYGIAAESLNKDVGGNTTVTLLGNTEITANNGTGQLAIYAKGNDTNKGIISNVKSDGTLDDFGNQDLLGNELKISEQRVFKVKGNFKAEDNGLIHLDMTDGTNITGKTEIAGTGEIDFKIAGASSVWQMTGDSTLTNLTLASGATIYLGGIDDHVITQQTLTVSGDYAGQNGRLIFNGALNGDGNSPIDQVVIKGNASGTTRVGVNNIGGLGEKTVNGIKIITVEGTNTNGKNTFVNDGRIVSGAYDYFVTKGNEQGGDTNNWYLTNKLSDEVGPPVIRPEGGAYLGNALGANNLFQLSLHDRVGEVGAGSWTSLGLDNQKGNVWARVDKRKSFVKEKSGQIELNQDYDVVQVGVDLIRKQKNNRTYLFGVMGGYGDVKTNSRGLLSKAEGRIHGYSVGVYGTFYDEHPDKSGKYIDSWILWNTFDGQVTGDGLKTEKYDLDGWTASIEAGYDQLLRKGKSSSNQNIWLKWQGQITYQGVRADGHRESNGTYVGKNDTNVQTRVGMRFYKKMKSDKGLWSQPFAELNWYHNTSTYDVSMDGDRDFSTRGARNVAELKIGYEGQVSKNLQLWGHIFGATGTHSHYSYGVRLGAKYTF